MKKDDMPMKENSGVSTADMARGHLAEPCMTDSQERYKKMMAESYEWPPKEEGGFAGRPHGEER